MDESSIKDLASILSAADSLALSWVWQRCWESCFVEPGDDIFRRPILESGVNLLFGAWNSLLETHPENGELYEQQIILQRFASDLSTFDNLILAHENHLQACNRRHQERIHKQDKSDIDRVDCGKPILLPFFYRPQNGPLLRISESAEHKRVSGDEYAKAYRSRYRWVYCPGGVRQQLKSIDLWRQGEEYPILLPFKFRLYHPGLTWDGVRSLPLGERYRKKGIFINGIRYQYVSRQTFTKVYGLSERVDITPVKWEIFKKVYFCLREGQGGQRKPPKAPILDGVVIPPEYRTAMASMTCVAKALNITPKKLKEIVDARPGSRMHIKGQSYVFDTRIPPFDELIGWDPPSRKRKKNRQT